MLYFFDLIDGSDRIDTLGSDLPSLVEAKVEGLRLAGEMLRHADRKFLTILSLWKVRVRDGAGVVQFELCVDSQDGSLRSASRDDEQEELLKRFEALVKEGRENVRKSRELRS